MLLPSSSFEILPNGLDLLGGHVDLGLGGFQKVRQGAQAIRLCAHCEAVSLRRRPKSMD
jgi:hypothetical protein